MSAPRAASLPAFSAPSPALSAPTALPRDRRSPPPQMPPRPQSAPTSRLSPSIIKKESSKPQNPLAFPIPPHRPPNASVNNLVPMHSSSPPLAPESKKRQSPELPSPRRSPRIAENPIVLDPETDNGEELPENIRDPQYFTEGEPSNDELDHYEEDAPADEADIYEKEGNDDYVPPEISEAEPLENKEDSEAEPLQIPSSKRRKTPPIDNHPQIVMTSEQIDELIQKTRKNTVEDVYADVLTKLAQMGMLKMPSQNPSPAPESPSSKNIVLENLMKFLGRS